MASDLARVFSITTKFIDLFHGDKRVFFLLDLLGYRSLLLLLPPHSRSKRHFS
ncbi:hypothetical protein A8V23_06775 [Yersinia pestis]|uniref:Uncharacterized protein n=1 Tax=Yersinia pestis TaxID=632 RepID=Q74TG6_YERPE|nr:hypothetical protein BAY22_10705 [Yersinia pestis]EDM42172.1 hypothetical protein YPE_0855 [Yersinia pestis CA88-4125]KJG86708.1 hypothetical protein RN23_04695 [Yersinia pestis subsp. microtus bv. Ulegeica]KKM53419.1 hypothetical protein KD37_01620 [Yersinia pestis subsp. pestis bv. Orientalis]KPD44157.1 hypothetical protein AC472_09475 [Yersinia pestis subsp. microtus bv. Caucasica]KPD55392.1 hypothetical protein AC596_09345 [Yersinia pestis subsp. microtus bv. Hissarica]KPD57232.1 hypot